VPVAAPARRTVSQAVLDSARDKLKRHPSTEDERRIYRALWRARLHPGSIELK
jgi:hypothetical protein